jgi:hypothetical protein
MLSNLWYGVEVWAQGLSVHSAGLSERLWGLRVDSDTIALFSNTGTLGRWLRRCTVQIRLFGAAQARSREQGLVGCQTCCGIDYWAGSDTRLMVMSTVGYHFQMTA